MLCTVEVIWENVDFLEMDGYQGRMQVCWSLTRFEHCCAIGDESNELTLWSCVIIMIWLTFYLKFQPYWNTRCYAPERLSGDKRGFSEVGHAAWWWSQLLRMMLNNCKCRTFMASAKMVVCCSKQTQYLLYDSVSSVSLWFKCYCALGDESNELTLWSV